VGIINLNFNNKYNSNNLLNKLGLEVNASGHVCSEKVSSVLASFQELLDEHRALLLSVSKIGEHNNDNSLKFAKLCGEIDFTLEEQTIESISLLDQQSKPKSKVIKLDILSKKIS